MRYILFELKEGLLIAFRALRANKVRTSLTTRAGRAETANRRPVEPRAFGATNR